MERELVLYSVPLTLSLVVGMKVVKHELENSISPYLMPLYPPREELQMVTTETEDHSSFVSIVNPLVLLLGGFDVIFLKLMGHPMLIYT